MLRLTWIADGMLASVSNQNAFTTFRVRLGAHYKQVCVSLHPVERESKTCTYLLFVAAKDDGTTLAWTRW
jgi:hypothetical protein